MKKFHDLSEKQKETIAHMQVLHMVNKMINEPIKINDIGDKKIRKKIKYICNKMDKNKTPWYKKNAIISNYGISNYLNMIATDMCETFFYIEKEEFIDLKKNEVVIIINDIDKFNWY